MGGCTYLLVYLSSSESEDYGLNEKIKITKKQGISFYTFPVTHLFRLMDNGDTIMFDQDSKVYFITFYHKVLLTVNKI